jgi:hypothetical protein
MDPRNILDYDWPDIGRERQIDERMIAELS